MAQMGLLISMVSSHLMCRVYIEYKYNHIKTAQAQQSRTLSEDEMLRRCSLQEYSLIKHRQKKQQLLQDGQQQQQAATKGNHTLSRGHRNHIIIDTINVNRRWCRWLCRPTTAGYTDGC